jgi:hypothetical protein
VLDIGEEVGALVLYTNPELHGQEIEVSLLDARAARVHSAVLERGANGRTMFAAVYPELPAGRYRVCREPGPMFAIAPGAVTEIRLS